MALPSFGLADDIVGPLVVDSPDDSLRSCRVVQRLIDRAQRAIKRGVRLEHIKYNVARCNQIDPGSLLILLHAAEQFIRLGCTAWVEGRGAAMQVIQENLAHYLVPRSHRPPAQQKGVYLLRKVSNRNDMVAELDDWAESVRQVTEAGQEEIALWQTQISEITTNAFQHGPTLLNNQAFPIYMAGRAKEGMVQLAALDCGSGIPAVIATINPPDRRDGRMISYACQPGITSRCSPQNQGAGLPSLVSTIRDQGGLLQILSHDGLAYVKKGRMYNRTLPPRANGSRRINGTLTIIAMKVRGGKR